MKESTEEKDKKFMSEALKMARLAFDNGEVPVGAVLVQNDKIISKAYNQTELLNDVTAHAEILALTSASAYTQTKYFPKATLYVTLEPCAMCAAALGWAKLNRVVYAASDEKKGFTQTAPKVLHEKCTYSRGILASKSSDLLKRFFDRKR